MGEPEAVATAESLVLVVTVSETSSVACSSDFAACCTVRTTPAKEVMVMEMSVRRGAPHTKYNKYRGVVP